MAELFGPRRERHRIVLNHDLALTVDLGSGAVVVERSSEGSWLGLRLPLV